MLSDDPNNGWKGDYEKDNRGKVFDVSSFSYNHKIQFQIYFDFDIIRAKKV